MSGLGARVAESFGSLGRVFANPGLRRLELAFLGSTMGHWTYVVGLSVYAYDQGGTTAVGVISRAAAASGRDRVAVPRDARRPLSPRARDDGDRPRSGRR